jgi:hypothetical protein
MQVAECYIHVKYSRDLTPTEFNSLSERLFVAATELAETIERAQRLDFTFEEGTLWQRILLWGSLTLNALDFLSHYHDLRESVADLVHQGEQFSDYAIKEFHQITNTKPKDNIYKRISSRDMNRLRRIITNFDRASERIISSSELPHVRNEVIHDLAGLARANPDDPEIAKIFELLPKDQIPDLPSSPPEAISIDDSESDNKAPSPEEPEPDAEPEPKPRQRGRRFHKQMALPKRGFR